jgi:hypothetical protein
VNETWRFERALARVERVAEAVVAEYATSYCQRPARRVDIRPPRPLPGVQWSIDGELVLEFVHHRDGRDELCVHDVALLTPLRKRLRSRRLRIEHVTTEWAQ